jgi:hypothetical protein
VIAKCILPLGAKGYNAGEQTTVIRSRDMSKKKRPHLVLVDGSTVAQRDLPLTAKQSGFIQTLMGKDANGKPVSLSDAYRANYNTGNMTAKTVHEKASILAGLDKMRARLDALTQQQADVTLRSTRSRLDFVHDRLMQEAIVGGSENQTAASRVRALELIGKLNADGGSLFEERITTEEARPAHELRAELEERISRLLGGEGT